MEFIEFVSQFTEFFNLIISFFILLVVGFVAGKTRVVDTVASKKLSALIIKIGQPALIINSLIKMEYSAENLGLSFKTLLFGFAVHIFMAALAFLAFRGIKSIDGIIRQAPCNKRKFSTLAFKIFNSRFILFGNSFVVSIQRTVQIGTYQYSIKFPHL